MHGWFSILDNDLCWSDPNGPMARKEKGGPEAAFLVVHVAFLTDRT